MSEDQQENPEMGILRANEELTNDKPGDQVRRVEVYQDKVLPRDESSTFDVFTGESRVRPPEDLPTSDDEALISLRDAASQVMELKLAEVAELEPRAEVIKDLTGAQKFVLGELISQFGLGDDAEDLQNELREP